MRLLAAFLAGTCAAGGACVQSGMLPTSTPLSVRARTECATLTGFRVSAAAIGLPTTGATITTAELVAPRPQTVDSARVVLATPEYCRVVGAIAPVDPAAPPIRFQVNMPTNWNAKTIQLGGSGTNGSIPVALNTGMQWGPESIPPNAPYALSRGFVVYGSDSGHQSGAAGASWVTNRESLTNFAYAQMKKTHDVALALIDQFYGREPRRSYYMGSSQGGREALMMAQRFPRDYDGIFSQVPVFPTLEVSLIDPLLRARAQAGEGWIPAAKVSLIGAEVRRQCDSLDGLADGLVSNYQACNTRIGGQTAFSAIRCSSGADEGTGCLSDAQLRALNDTYADDVLPFPLAFGWSSYPGWTTGSELPNNWKALQRRPMPDSFNIGYLGPLLPPSFTANPLTAPLEELRAVLPELSALLDAQNPDLSEFRRAGGKLLLKVNTTDYAANPRWSYEYYDRVVETMGQSVVDEFMRFYVAVGVFHNRNIGRNPVTNELVPAYIDFIAMLDDWVDGGIVPGDSPAVTDMEVVPPFTVRATFPMCRYPTYARYIGSGDPKRAESYTCTR